jgi:hypothetical protein
MYPRLTTAFLLILLVVSCKKDPEDPIENTQPYEWLFYGEYRGTLKISENNTPIETDSAYLTFDGANYYSCRLVNNNWSNPMGHGYYSATSNDTILDSVYFQDNNYYTANFDWSLILQGSYQALSVSDSSISFSKFNSGNNRTYQYDLIKM